MNDEQKTTKPKPKMGRPPKLIKGKTLFIPASIIKYVEAMLEIEKELDNKQAKQ
jgi:hypothetical protein